MVMFHSWRLWKAWTEWLSSFSSLCSRRFEPSSPHHRLVPRHYQTFGHLSAICQSFGNWFKREKSWVRVTPFPFVFRDQKHITRFVEENISGIPVPIKLVGRRSTSRDSSLWSYKENSPAQRFMFVQDSRSWFPAVYAGYLLQNWRQLVSGVEARADWRIFSTRCGGRLWRHIGENSYSISTNRNWSEYFFHSSSPSLNFEDTRWFF